MALFQELSQSKGARACVQDNGVAVSDVAQSGDRDGALFITLLLNALTKRFIKPGAMGKDCPAKSSLQQAFLCQIV
jgi:hypothetical protein